MVTVRRLVARRARWVAGFALVAAALTGCQAGPEVHDDQDGPLSATSGWGSFTMDEPPSQVPRPWYATFMGNTLCVHEPGVKIELRGAGWRVASDAKPLAVHAWLRMVDRTTKPTTPYGALDGTPWKPYSEKPLPGEYTDKLAGRVISQSCAERTHKEFTELLFVVKVGKQGAEVPQAWVDYLADGEPHRLMIRWRMAACGEAIAARRDDTGPPPCD